jgi:hypothetical protein
MSIRSIGLIAATLITTSFAAGSALAQGAVEAQVLPDGSVMVVNIRGTSEFCIDPQDRSTCRVLAKPCDFIVANRATRQITDPETVSSEAVLAYGGPNALPLIQDNRELVSSFKFGGNECGLSKTAKALIDNRPDNDEGPEPPDNPGGEPPQGSAD